MPAEPDPDPTRVRDQPAIRTGRRRQWLVPAGLMAGITVGLLVAALGLETAVPLAGITATALLYLAMLVVAAAVRTARIRNLAFAWLMGLIAVVALGSLLLLLLSERAGAGRRGAAPAAPLCAEVQLGDDRGDAPTGNVTQPRRRPWAGAGITAS